MNSQVIHESSPEGTSGLWRVGFMEKKGFVARIKECRGDGKSAEVMEQLVLLLLLPSLLLSERRRYYVAQHPSR